MGAIVIQSGIVECGESAAPVQIKVDIELF